MENDENSDMKIRPKPQLMCSLSASDKEVDAFVQQAVEKENEGSPTGARPKLRQGEQLPVKNSEADAQPKKHTLDSTESHLQSKDSNLKDTKGYKEQRNRELRSATETKEGPELHLETELRAATLGTDGGGLPKSRKPCISDISLQAMENDLKEEEEFEQHPNGARPKIILEGQKKKRRSRIVESTPKIDSKQKIKYTRILPTENSRAFRPFTSKTPHTFNEYFSATENSMVEQRNSIDHKNCDRYSWVFERLESQRRLKSQYTLKKDQSVQTEPGFGRCPFCLGQIVLESLSHRLWQVERARQRRERGIVDDQAFDSSFPISATVVNHFTRDVAVEVPDRTYYGSRQLKFFRFGNLVYRVYTYRTLEGRIEYVPRRPVGIPLDELRVKNPIRTPGSH